MLIHEAYILFERAIVPELVIGGDDPHKFTLRQLEPFLEAGGQAKVLFVTHMNNAGVVKSAGHLRSIIRRMVIHDQNFKVRIALAQDG